MGFLEILTLIFVVLKLTGEIHWSWAAVFSPIIIAGIFYFLLLMVIILKAK